jgi:hypothetical protein
MALTPEQQRANETLVAMTKGGAIYAVPVGGNSGAPQKVADEVFKKMSAAERLDYARQFDQKQYLPHGRRQDNAAMPPWKDSRLPK